MSPLDQCTLDQCTLEAGSSVASGPDALIKEARRRQRRRYLLIGLALCVTAAATGIALEVTGGNGGGSPSKSGHGTAPPHPSASAQRLSTAGLPASVLFDQIVSTPEGLLVTGVTAGTVDSVKQMCADAVVDPRTLRVGQISTGSCDDPRLSGHTVEPISAYVGGSNDAKLSISSVEVSGKVIVGPPVMAYGSLSDTRPVTAYGSSSLWVYDVETTSGAELLQVSIPSGKVVDRVTMPKLYRPLLAADDGGVWVANSIDGSAGHALYYVPSGASAPTEVNADDGLPVCWLTASGASAWVGVGDGWNCGKQSIQEYAAGAREPVYSSPARNGVTPFYVIGDDTDGLWAMQWTPPLSPGKPRPQQVIYIDPTTGKESVAATLPPVVYPTSVPSDGLVAGQGVYLDGALYLLEPPFRANGYLGYSSIVRVTLPKAP